MSKKDIKVPNIGDFKDVEVIEILVKQGQKIKKNDPLITIESDKSSVEIPSLENGVITLLNVNIGDKVSEGDKILEVDLEDAQDSEVKKETVEPKIIKIKQPDIRPSIPSIKFMKLIIAVKKNINIKMLNMPDSETISFIK